MNTSAFEGSHFSLRARTKVERRIILHAGSTDRPPCDCASQTCTVETFHPRDRQPAKSRDRRIAILMTRTSEPTKSPTRQVDAHSPRSTHSSGRRRVRAFHRTVIRDAMQAVTHRAAAGPTAVARRASSPSDIARAVPGCHRQLDAAVPARVSSRRAFRRGGTPPRRRLRERRALRGRAGHLRPRRGRRPAVHGASSADRPTYAAKMTRSRIASRPSRRFLHPPSDRRHSFLSSLTSASASKRFAPRFPRHRSKTAGTRSTAPPWTPSSGARWRRCSPRSGSRCCPRSGFT
jgi:hypothetical protein